MSHGGTAARLPPIAAPTLVLAGGRDPTARPELGSAVAGAIPGALFEVMECESHQPFQEIPDVWNARIDAFWQDVETRVGPPPRPRGASDRERMAAPADRPTS
jgi:3-oxoadipate enol-lactonase